MAYSTNPSLPQVRRDAVNFVLAGHSTREAARHFGYTHSAVVKWMKRAASHRGTLIRTRSSRPLHHPDELPSGVISRILAVRREKDQCAEVIHHRLLKEGLIISLSSIKRTLKRNQLTRFSKWKKWHQYTDRPLPEKPGILVEIDSMQEGAAAEHLRAYALIDVCSRWAYVEACERVNAARSVSFVHNAAAAAPFSLRLIQTDNGAEFSKHFTIFSGVAHRHTRVRTPTDNAHVERFIQTLQRQCLNRIPRDIRSWKRELPEFLRWYNFERPHMGLDMQTPIEYLKRFQAID